MTLDVQSIIHQAITALDEHGGIGRLLAGGIPGQDPRVGGGAAPPPGTAAPPRFNPNPNYHKRTVEFGKMAEAFQTEMRRAGKAVRDLAAASGLVTGSMRTLVRDTTGFARELTKIPRWAAADVARTGLSAGLHAGGTDAAATSMVNTTFHGLMRKLSQLPYGIGLAVQGAVMQRMEAGRHDTEVMHFKRLLGRNMRYEDAARLSEIATIDTPVRYGIQAKEFAQVFGGLGTQAHAMLEGGSPGQLNRFGKNALKYDLTTGRGYGSVSQLIQEVGNKTGESGYKIIQTLMGVDAALSKSGGNVAQFEQVLRQYSGEARMSAMSTVDLAGAFTSVSNIYKGFGLTDEQANARAAETTAGIVKPVANGGINQEITSRRLGAYLRQGAFADTGGVDKLRRLLGNDVVTSEIARGLTQGGPARQRAIKALTGRGNTEAMASIEIAAPLLFQGLTKGRVEHQVIGEYLDSKYGNSWRTGNNKEFSEILKQMGKTGSVEEMEYYRNRFVEGKSGLGAPRSELEKAFKNYLGEQGPLVQAVNMVQSFMRNSSRELMSYLKFGVKWATAAFFKTRGSKIELLKAEYGLGMTSDERRIEIEEELNNYGVNVSAEAARNKKLDAYAKHVLGVGTADDPATARTQLEDFYTRLGNGDPRKGREMLQTALAHKAKAMSDLIVQKTAYNQGREPGDPAVEVPRDMRAGILINLRTKVREALDLNSHNSSRMNGFLTKSGLANLLGRTNEVEELTFTDPAVQKRIEAEVRKRLGDSGRLEIKVTATPDALAATPAASPASPSS
jgi:hypothetical protein